MRSRSVPVLGVIVLLFVKAFEAARGDDTLFVVPIVPPQMERAGLTSLCGARHSAS
ncbi:hypothetical protein PA7_13560 [Pseudonocardia asaccharolytica DSM 44247 = NBRC 16224]|uniref:Uncharacterized protein n=1 Tax=Pseudonocardia asaccharolytica DSM 44247 = NBRC 16224 TaxID=1123024 RepID=A0A511CY74_9PSEU|nr:hypothetical protein PA7_13560 [Pseudonocardia asaccharolytica DSM 44247 = NBRC 16224]